MICIIRISSWFYFLAQFKLQSIWWKFIGNISPKNRDLKEIYNTNNILVWHFRDPMHCKKGDSFITKPAAKNNTIEQPRMWVSLADNMMLTLD